MVGSPKRTTRRVWWDAGREATPGGPAGEKAGRGAREGGGQQEYRQKVAERFDRIDARLDRLEERV